ncbi:MAG: amidohydrolase family protein, partial [Pseudomonadota bacterium]
IFLPVLDKFGLRASIGIMLNDLDLQRFAEGETIFSDAERERQLQQASDLIDNCRALAHDRVHPVVALTGLSSSSKSLLNAARELVDQRNVRMSAHLGFGEREAVQQVHGANQLDLAEDCGVLGADLTAVHCYEIDESELNTLARSGAQIAHCPYMNQFRGEIAAIETMRDRDMTVGLGIDNYFSDYFDLMRACIASARLRAGRPDVLSAAEVLRMGTIESARAIGRESEVGSLEIGKKADLQIVDMRRPGLALGENVINTLIYHAHANDVDTVMVDGVFRVRDSVLVDLPMEDLLSQAIDASHAAWSRFAQRHGTFVAPAP